MHIINPNPKFFASDTSGFKKTEDINLESDELKIAAVIKATEYLGDKRPDLAQYLKESSVAAVEKEGKYFVSFGVKGPRGYEYFSFWVNLEDETIEPTH
jgi:hypothetical protein